MTRWRLPHAVRDRHTLGDLAVAALVFALARLTTTAAPGGDRATAGLLCCLVACGALVGRRHHPLAVLTVSALAAEGYLLVYTGHDGDLVLVAPMVAIYTVASTTDRKRGLAISGLAVLALAAVHIAVKPGSAVGVDNLALAALGALAAAAGDAARSHRAYLAEVEARARQAEADREAEAARRVTEERLRIARDLHDAVGHQLALINVQAGVVAHVLGEPPEAARQALAHIGVASRAALAELSETVGLLRAPEDPAVPTEPVPGLADLPRLLASFRRSGLAITAEVTGAARPLPPGADRAAYRVIQEALTNVCKHAGPVAVTVLLAYRRTGLRVAVENAAGGGVPGPPPGRAGHGLVGMRERVAALGGQLRSGPLPGGGYRVSAVLPAARTG